MVQVVCESATAKNVAMHAWPDCHCTPGIALLSKTCLHLHVYGLLECKTLKHCLHVFGCLHLLCLLCLPSIPFGFDCTCMCDTTTGAAAQACMWSCYVMHAMQASQIMPVAQGLNFLW